MKSPWRSYAGCCGILFIHSGLNAIAQAAMPSLTAYYQQDLAAIMVGASICCLAAFAAAFFAEKLIARLQPRKTLMLSYCLFSNIVRFLLGMFLCRTDGCLGYLCSGSGLYPADEYGSSRLFNGFAFHRLFIGQRLLSNDHRPAAEDRQCSFLLSNYVAVRSGSLVNRLFRFRKYQSNAPCLKEYISFAIKLKSGDPASDAGYGSGLANDHDLSQFTDDPLAKSGNERF